MAVEVTIAPKGRGDLRKVQGKGIIASGPGMRRGSAKMVALLWEEKNFDGRGTETKQGKACFLPIVGSSRRTTLKSKVGAGQGSL